MAIPEAQLETWSHQGAMQSSSTTYRSVKGVLESSAVYGGQSFSVFLQGSYGNDTNIYAESDVDIVIRQGNFFHNIEDLGGLALAAFNRNIGVAAYPFSRFKTEVMAHLTSAFGNDARPGNKAVTIAAANGRRKSDVIIAAEYRFYTRYVSQADSSYYDGICFWTGNGTRIINFPRQHSANLTTKHQNTSNRFKPMARILKNVRCKLVDDGVITPDLAPSYYIEGLLYNVPNENFVASKCDTFVNCINYVLNNDRNAFRCAHQMYPLLSPVQSPVMWQADNCTTFLRAVASLWQNWR